MSKKNTDTALAPLQDAESLLFQPTAADIAKRLKTGVMAAVVLNLEEGFAFEGEVIGTGQVITTKEKDDAGDEVEKLIPTIRMKHANGTLIDMMQSYQLEKDLLPLVGQIAFVQKMPAKRVGKKMINQFAVIDMGTAPEA